MNVIEREEILMKMGAIRKRRALSLYLSPWALLVK